MSAINWNLMADVVQFSFFLYFHDFISTVGENHDVVEMRSPEISYPRPHAAVHSFVRSRSQFRFGVWIHANYRRSPTFAAVNRVRDRKKRNEYKMIFTYFFSMYDVLFWYF